MSTHLKLNDSRQKPLALDVSNQVNVRVRSIDHIPE